MTEQQRCQAGDWVEVEFILLDPADRSKNLPEDTAAQPLRVWVKGFAQASAATGEELTIETVTGRRVTGTFTELNPGYFHTFGRPIPELVHVGSDLRKQLAEYRAREAGGCGCGCGGEGGA